MAVVTAAEIRDRDSFRAWLEARPEASHNAAITVIASRIALRMLPLLNRKEKLALSQHTTLIKLTFWRIAISRSVRTWPDREIAAAAAAADTYADAVYADAVYADAVYAASVYTAAYAAADAAAYAAAAAAADNIAFAAASDDVIWEFIRIDAAIIEAGEYPFTLYAKPLWQEAPPWRRDEWQAFKTTLTAPDMADGEWAVWIEWYDSITQGHPAFNLQTADTLERAIALGGKDNKFHKEFWDRKPGEINREIAEWVAEAKIAEALQVGPGSGLRFQYRNGLIALGKYLGLNGSTDDRKRIAANLPQLAELADILKSALDAREAPYPTLLLKTLERFTNLVKSSPPDIEPDHLFAAATLLRGQIESAGVPSATSNAPPLEDGELALAKSITLISDLVVLGTARGKELFDDADRAAKDSGPDEKFIALSKELFELVKDQGGVMEEVAVDLLLDVLGGGKLAPHPKRFAFLQEGSAKNAMIVIGVVALISFAPAGSGVLAFLADKLFDIVVMVGGGYYLSDDARTKIDGFIQRNEGKLRAIAKEKQSLKWLDDVLYLIEKNREKNNQKPK